MVSSAPAKQALDSALWPYQNGCQWCVRDAQISRVSAVGKIVKQGTTNFVKIICDNDGTKLTIQPYTL